MKLKLLARAEKARVRKEKENNRTGWITSLENGLFVIQNTIVGTCSSFSENSSKQVKRIAKFMRNFLVGETYWVKAYARRTGKRPPPIPYLNIQRPTKPRKKNAVVPPESPPPVDASHRSTCYQPPTPTPTVVPPASPPPVDTSCCSTCYQPPTPTVVPPASPPPVDASCCSTCYQPPTKMFSVGDKVVYSGVVDPSWVFTVTGEHMVSSAYLLYFLFYFCC